MKTVLVALFCLFIGGCQVFKPETPAETVAGGYITVTRLTTATQSAVANSFVTPEQGRKAYDNLVIAKQGLDEASVVLAEPNGNPQDSIQKAQAALRIVEKILGAYANEQH
jgi:hypothetical protein